MATAQEFSCPNCGALYRLVRVEAENAVDRELTCLACGGPLQGREGRFVLKSTDRVRLDSAVVLCVVPLRHSNGLNYHPSSATCAPMPIEFLHG